MNLREPEQNCLQGMVLLSAALLLPLSIFMTVILLHLELSGLGAELLPVDLGHEPNQQSDVNKALYSLCMLKMTRLHVCRIILHFIYYKNKYITVLLGLHS